MDGGKPAVLNLRVTLCKRYMKRMPYKLIFYRGDKMYKGIFEQRNKLLASAKVS